jgi:hypothetical protein
MLLGDFPNALVIAVVAALWRVASHELVVQLWVTTVIKIAINENNGINSWFFIIALRSSYVLSDLLI